MDWAGEEDINWILSNCKTIAVVGLSDKTHRDSYRVSHYMRQVGYRIIPVNPMLEEQWGEKAYPALTEVPDEIDLVNVFRRSEYLPEVVERTLDKGARAMWTQLGVLHEDALTKAREAGLKVVMDRCIMVEHRNRN